ncbi:MAG: MBL fold metallo-hydrolase [Pseudomonadota bacterium]
MFENFDTEAAEFANKSRSYAIDTGTLSEGVSQLDAFIIHRSEDHIRIYDRICDHNAGRLITNAGRVRCPLHGWELDPATGRYMNVDCEKKPLYSGAIPKEPLIIEMPEARRALKGFSQNLDVSIRYLNHACLVIETDGLRIGTDPWIEGPAFCNGWWLAEPSPVDSYDVLNACDALFISHNHPDHLHAASLSHVRKDMPILTPKFPSGSTVRYLRDLGFTDIHAANVTDRLVHKDREIALSVLKSGDFRDDGGLMIEIGTFTMIASVDSNFIDFWRYPDHLTLLAHSFAGGASGFPLCFDNYSDDEKERLLVRNRNSVRAINRQSLQKATPSAFLPYAGFFKESAARDAFVLKRNRKNSIADYASDCQDLGIELIDVTDTDLLTFKGDKFTGKHASRSKRMEASDPSLYLDATKIKYPSLDIQEIETYFVGSHFQKALALRLDLVNDTFENTEQTIYIDFYESRAPKISFEAPQPREVRTLNIRVRAPEFRQVLKQGLPWEDLSIGFQCRITRSPNVYNSDFWYHFTNVYVNDAVKTRTEDCSACIVIDQALV